MKTSYFIATLALSIFYTSLVAQTFTLRSSDLGGQALPQQVFNGSGCKGFNVSPQLSWDDVPPGTRSFAVTLHDENAQTGSGWWHWVIFDIPEDVRELKSDAGNITKGLSPKGSVQSPTDFGQSGYGGPCPPVGDKPHKYTITLYALNVQVLGIDKNSNPATVGYYLNANAIQKASIVFYYKR
jgi:Raf kinase inhibitor-like YbhB/YbcL family protein